MVVHLSVVTAATGVTADHRVPVEAVAVLPLILLVTQVLVVTAAMDWWW